MRWLAMLTDWRIDPLATTFVIVLGGLYVDRWRTARSRGRRAPTGRLVSFLGGLAALLLAADSGVGVHDTALFSAHMVQHTLILVVAPPLLARGGPVTLLLQTSDAAMRRRVLAVARSRVVAAATHPLVAAAAYVVVLYVTHFTFVYDAALRSEPLHELEHAVYLTVGLMLWLPIIGADPLARRLPPQLGMLLLAVLGPYMAILGVIIYSADAPLFATHAARTAALGLDPLSDQQAAGAIMWFVSPLLMFPAFLWLGVRWTRREARRAVAVDHALARERGHAADEMTPVWWR